jgi:hypothetical protein
MAYEPKDGDFVLNINKRKQTAKHADYTGHIRQGGKKFFLNGWIKENKETSEEFISGNVGVEMTSQQNHGSPQAATGFPGRKVTAEATPTASAPYQAPARDPLDDTIPF